MHMCRFLTLYLIAVPSQETTAAIPSSTTQHAQLADIPISPGGDQLILEQLSQTRGPVTGLG